MFVTCIHDMRLICFNSFRIHYNDVTMSAVASEIAGISIVCSTVSKLLVTVFCGSHHKGSVTWKMIPFDDVITIQATLPTMTLSIASTRLAKHKIAAWLFQRIAYWFSPMPDYTCCSKLLSNTPVYTAHSFVYFIIYINISACRKCHYIPNFTEFHWSLFLMFELAIFQHWFR